MPNKLCKWCKVDNPNHWPYQCYKNPYLKQYGYKRVKPISKTGKQAKKWLDIRKQWFIENLADHYVCYLCGKWLTPAETTLDHVVPRSNAKNYANRHDFSNLRPCCSPCNSEKGSKIY